ncbi:helix-turn-helix domain-containing protein [Bacillus sp. 2205SS5-2]|uniref:helix-turn-helix domain-containing protein n=1 Tax=Bacillus sp. 2205SS5-2 TaxID=3109031 RepID=UPI003005E595
MGQYDSNISAFKIGSEKGLLNIIGLEPNSRKGANIKNTFDKAVERLKEDNFIGEYYYESFSDLQQTLNPRWFNDWLEAEIIISPSPRLYNNNHIDSILNQEKKQPGIEYRHVIRELNKTIESPKKETTFEREVTPELFKLARIKREMTIQAVSEVIGLSKSAVSRFENGKTTPSSNNMKKIKEWYFLD